MLAALIVYRGHNGLGIVGYGRRGRIDRIPDGKAATDIELPEFETVPDLHLRSQVQNNPDRFNIRLYLENLRAEVEVQPYQVQTGRRHCPGHRFTSTGKRDAELAVHNAGGDVLVRMGVNARRQPQQYIRSGTSLTGHLRQHIELLKIVDDNAPDFAFQGHVQFFGRLIVAVEIDLGHREINGTGDAQLAARDHIQSESLFLEKARQRSIDECFARVDYSCIPVAPAELVSELGTFLAQRCLIEKIKGRAELFRQRHRIAATDD